MDLPKNNGVAIDTTVDFKLLFESSPDLYLILLPDPAFTIVAVSDAYAAATMTVREDILGKPLFYVFPDNPADVNADGVNNLKASLLSAISTHRPHRMADQKYDIRRPDGTFEVRYWRPLNTPVVNNGEVAYLIHRVEDVTEQIRLQEEQTRIKAELKASEKRFRQVLESAPEAMVIVDADGLIHLVNKQTEKLFGYEANEIIGQKVEMLMPERFRRLHVKHREYYTGHPTVRQMGEGRELLGRRKDDSEFPIEISLSPMETETGMQVSAVIRDITERKKIENEIRMLNATLEQRVARRTEQLAASNKELEQFAYIASHDLQEPLRMVSSFLQLLQKRYKGHIDEKADSYINYAVDGAERMKKLILDLLEYSRIGTNTGQFSPVDFNEVAEHIQKVFINEIKKTGAVITFNHLPTLQGNKTQLIQLFQNMVGNALKYHSERKPEIHIDVQELAQHWLFSVADNGIGIEEEFYEKIFVVFQRLHNNSQYTGTGIGLALCKKIVESHGGKIWVESEIGKGTTFYFTINKNLAYKTL